MLLSLFGCGKSGDDFENGKKPEGAFKYYEYRSTTMREYPREYYRLENTEDKGLTLSWAKSNSPVTVLRVPEESVEKLTSLINQYKLYKMKDRYTPPFDVRDGIMWHVYFRYEGSSTSTSADNAWPPEPMKKGIEEINAYFGRLIEASSQEDIIEVKSAE
ncbi:MAG: hypothetical protein J5737_07750 [Bacteroidales bacterium]|nr:hypothetical protein [Bacteroidales bacterium]